MRTRRIETCVITWMFLAVVACGGKDPVPPEDAGYDPVIDASRFVGRVDNAFFPLTPGTTRIYLQDGPDGTERVEFTVTTETKTILGVTCVVVHDQSFVDDVLEEDTYDWFAQHEDGTVWYFGEATRKADDSGALTDTSGSWEAGVGGAKPGIIMLAHPKPGDAYREEYLEGSAEDQAEVVSLTESVHVAFGVYENCLQTKNYTRLDPLVENKYYCQGIGEVLVLENGLRGELTSLAASYDPIVDPSHFVAGVDNRFFPLVPGTKRVYLEVTPHGTERVDFTATRDTKEIMGVTCVVVHDQAFLDDVLMEDTFDWFAQDSEGAVWYFGESTLAADAAGALTDTSGSWEAGVDGARPGIIMPAHPEVGLKYREEFMAGEAEDEAEVVGASATADVPYGSFTGCIETRNFTRLDPAIENKFYCPGVGEVLVLEEGQRGELVSLTSL